MGNIGYESFEKTKRFDNIIQNINLALYNGTVFGNTNIFSTEETYKIINLPFFL